MLEDGVVLALERQGDQGFNTRVSGHLKRRGEIQSDAEYKKAHENEEEKQNKNQN